MKKLITIVALVGIPSVTMFFQVNQFHKEIKPKLEKEAKEIVEQAGVDQAAVTMSYLDVSISGITATEQDRELVKEKVRAVAGGNVVRVTESNDLKTYGSLEISKSDNQIVVNGKLAEGIWDEVFENESGVNYQQGDDFDEKAYFINPFILEEKGNEWLKKYFSLKGDRTLVVNAKTNMVSVKGAVTDRLYTELVASSVSAGLQLDAAVEIVKEAPIEYSVKVVGGELVATGVVPEWFDLSDYGFAKHSSVEKDAFVGGSSALSSAEFIKWQKEFLSDGSANRNYSVAGDEVMFHGNATPNMQRQWWSELKSMGLMPVSKLDLFASAFHYPSYQKVSSLDATVEGKLSAVLRANHLFFESGASEVIAEHADKLDQLAQGIKAYADGAQLIIGGHADSTGNMEVNRTLSNQRAEAVITELVNRGVKRSIFTIGAFGATRSSTQGSNERDRRVEIIIK